MRTGTPAPSAAGAAGPSDSSLMYPDEGLFELFIRVFAGDEQRPGVVHVGLHVLDEGHGRKRLAGEVRRANFGTAAAAHAGIGIEQLLPGEVLQFARPEARARLDQCFDITHRSEVERRGRALEEGVHRRKDDVPELREGHEREQPKRRNDVEPPPPDVRIEPCLLATPIPSASRRRAGGDQPTSLAAGIRRADRRPSTGMPFASTNPSAPR